MEKSLTPASTEVKNLFRHNMQYFYKTINKKTGWKVHFQACFLCFSSFPALSPTLVYNWPICSADEKTGLKLNHDVHQNCHMFHKTWLRKKVLLLLCTDARYLQMKSFESRLFPSSVLPLQAWLQKLAKRKSHAIKLQVKSPRDGLRLHIQHQNDRKTL